MMAAVPWVAGGLLLVVAVAAVIEGMRCR